MTFVASDALWKDAYFKYISENKDERLMKYIREFSHPRFSKFRKNLISLKKKKHKYMKRTIVEKNQSNMRHALQVFSVVITPIFFTICLCLSTVLFGIYFDRYIDELDGVLAKLLVCLPLLISGTIYIAGVVLYTLRETLCCKLGFRDRKHVRQFLGLVCAPLFFHCAAFFFAFKWILLPDSSWLITAIPCVVVFVAYYLPVLVTILVQWLKKMRQKHQEKGSVTDEMSLDQIEEPGSSVTDVMRREDTEGSTFGFIFFYTLCVIFFLCCTITMILIPTKMDNLIKVKWGVTFTPIWINFIILMFCVPSWCAWEMCTDTEPDSKRMSLLSLVPCFATIPGVLAFVFMVLALDGEMNFPFTVGCVMLAFWEILIGIGYTMVSMASIMTSRQTKVEL